MSNITTVLNVDDHAPARFVRTRILQRAGFAVQELDNAAEAVERGPQASLLLLDVKLPDGDGFSVCESVKKAAPGVPVVMVTSVYRTTQARRDAFAIGADAFLLEPVAADQLVRTVTGLIRRKKEWRPEEGLAWIRTDGLGQVEDLSDEAGKLLNLSRRGARGRSLPAFVTDNRTQLITDILHASEGLVVDRVVTLQPRDRRPVRVHLDVSALPVRPGERLQLDWIVTPEVS